MEEQTAKILEGVYRDGSPEYAELQKDIIISTDDKTVQSPTGMGTISMYINGKITQQRHSHDNRSRGKRRGRDAI